MADDLEAARVAELAKLGSNGTARIAAVSTWLDAKGMGELKSSLFTAKNVEHYERLIRDSTGLAPPKPAPKNEAQRDGKVTDEQYNAMSPRERMVYAREHQERMRR